MNPLFRHRAEAGIALAGRLRTHAVPDTDVFGIDAGSTLLAAEIARELAVPLDLLLVQTLDLPCEEKIVLGVVAAEGTCVLNDELIDLLDVEADAVGSLRGHADMLLRQREQVLRGGRPLRDMRDRTAILIAEVVESDLPLRAALLYLHQHAPRKVVVAAPVIARSAFTELQLLAQEVIALHVPDHSPPVEEVYAEAARPTDIEVRRALGVPEPIEAPLPSPATDD